MSGLRIGYGERVVSPPLGLDISGYGFYLGRKAGGVVSKTTLPGSSESIALR